MKKKVKRAHSAWMSLPGRSWQREKQNDRAIGWKRCRACSTLSAQPLWQLAHQASHVHGQWHTAAAGGSARQRRPGPATLKRVRCSRPVQLKPTLATSNGCSQHCPRRADLDQLLQQDMERLRQRQQQQQDQQGQQPSSSSSFSAQQPGGAAPPASGGGLQEVVDKVGAERGGGGAALSLPEGQLSSLDSCSSSSSRPPCPLRAGRQANWGNAKLGRAPPARLRKRRPRSPLAQVLIADFFFILAALAWLGAGLVERSALNSTVRSWRPASCRWAAPLGSLLQRRDVGQFAAWRPGL